ncbi:hypothetical protein PN483_10345 [Nodularia spumigena CS-591/04]|uniref:hypothetical protein n=1 Tax=Nodularia spumigena TaxID=70799 RepID=UPI0023310095|nr:hypothetical protein [Nodularia spumigena]MDB9322326.1 hypothetical protein [Nodularia spumigena CS-591/07A]MDB9330887.1 hypothetical protein [Nodularia spumigena CS-591/04]MDB9360192.1 hypothetical protein [Nodularia spumigena CS-588/02]MDB9366135.1 hypothetical protein [Nodularia spumigena CS-588/02A10]
MSRRIITTRYQSLKGEEIPPDSYLDRIIKYIPADIVGGWIAITGLINSSEQNVRTDILLWIGFVAGIVLTALWTLKQTSLSNKKLAITQTLVSTISFAVWVFALGGPFVNLEFYRPLYGSLLLIFYNLSIGLIIPKEN